MSSPALITVFLPGPLRSECGGKAELTLRATSVREALAILERLHPRLHRCVCDETGAVRRHINLFVNHHHMRDCQGLETVFATGDTLTILPAVSGG